MRLRFVLSSVSAILAVKSIAQAGTLDPSFSADGIYTANLHPWFDEVWALAVQDDGKVIGAGIIGDLSDQSILVHRLTADGNPDSTWGNGGLVVLSGIAPGRTADAIAVQSNGRVIVAGAAFDSIVGYDAIFYGLTPSGALDATFGQGGILMWDYNEGVGDQSVLDLHILSDDRIMAAGTGASGLVCARLLPDGAPDMTYASSGVATTGSADSKGICFSVNDSGAAVVGGALGYDWLVTRFDADGNMDPNFGSNGIVSLDFGVFGAWESVLGIAELADGRIIACGYSGYFGLDDVPHLAMFMPDGSFDNGFGNGGVLSLPYTLPEFGQFRDVLTMPNNTFIVAGFRQMGANPVGLFTLSRFLGDGSFDPSFASGGQVSTDVCASLEAAWEMAMAPDGSVVVGGWAATSAHTDVAVAKYFNDLSTGVPKPELSADVVSVVPCPASDHVEFSGLAENTGSTTFTFTDASGHVVHTHIDRSNGRSNSIRVQLPASMKSGAYIVTISSGSSLGHARCIVTR